MSPPSPGILRAFTPLLEAFEDKFWEKFISFHKLPGFVSRNSSFFMSLAP
jgi:hypothetical protein